MATLRPDSISMTGSVARSSHIGNITWFAGLSGARKSTLAFELERLLFDVSYSTVALDGHELRRSLNSNLGSSKEDRFERIRGVAATANLFAAESMLAIVSLTSPFAEDHVQARRNARAPFHEVFVRATLDVCRRRDPKGLYERGASGAIRQFTGIEFPYEPPECLDLVIDTCATPISERVNYLFNFVRAAVPIRVASANTCPAKSLSLV